MIDAIEPLSGNSGVEPTAPVPPAKGSGTDGVVLSDVAHASLLEQEGMSVSEIAAELGLTAVEVQNDLGIAATITQAEESTAHPDQGGATGTVSQA